MMAVSLIPTIIRQQSTFSKKITWSTKNLAFSKKIVKHEIFTQKHTPPEEIFRPLRTDPRCGR